MRSGHLYLAYEQFNAGCSRTGTCVGLFFYSSTSTPPADGGIDVDAGDAGPPPHYFTGGPVDPSGSWPQPSGKAMSMIVDVSGVPALAFVGAPDNGTPPPAGSPFAR